jgi:hypothetical protein
MKHMTDEKKEFTPGIGVEARKINEAFDRTGINFHSRPDALAALKTDGREIVFNEDDGEPYVHYDSEFLKLDQALTRLALDQRSLADGRSLPRGASTARPNTLSRAEMTIAEKVAYVNEHGEEAFLKLPSRPTTTSEVKTTEDFRRLPRAEKVRRINEDPDAIRKLAPPPTARANGTFINHEALARQKAITGKR